MASTLPTDYDILQLGEEHGLEEWADEKGPHAVQPFLVEWGHRYAFANFLMGGSTVSGGVNGTWNQQRPYAHPESPNMYVRGVKIKPDGRLLYDPESPLTPVAYTHAIVTATFEVPQFTLDAAMDPGWFNSFSQDPTEAQAMLWATQELEFGRETFTLANTSLEWDDGSQIDSPVPMHVSTIDLTLTYQYFPWMPFGLFCDYADSVNDNTFLGREKGTVYFVGARTTREFGRAGVMGQRLQMHFRWRKVDHNYKYREDEATWQKVVGPGGGGPLYPYKPFRKLLFLP
jgi:hypothetical protein